MAADAVDPEARPDRARAVRAARNIAAAVIMLAAVGAAAWLALGGDVKRGPPPTITAEATPERAPPDPTKPNGAVIPHQGQEVYDIVGRERAKPAGEEKMAPAPERPLPPLPATEDRVGAATVERPEGPVQILPPPPKPDRIGAVPPSLPQTLPAAPREVARAPLPDSTPTTPSSDAPTGPTSDGGSAPSPPSARQLPPSADPKPEPPPLVPPTPRRAAAAAPEPKPIEKPQVEQPQEVAALTAPPGPFRIQLGAVRDKAAAQREWRRLKRKHADILGKLQVFVQEVDIAGKGVFHRIQAGPLPERELAEIACDQLKSRKAACFVIAR